MNKMTAPVLVTVALALFSSGCASVFNDQHAPMRIDTYNQAGIEVKDMDCKIDNGYGELAVKPPGTFKVLRSRHDLQIQCSKTGEPDAKGTAVSRANAGLFGNALIGGGIGVIIDHYRGNAYTYPQWVRLVVDKILTFDRRDDKDGEPNLGTTTLVISPIPVK